MTSGGPVPNAPPVPGSPTYQPYPPTTQMYSPPGTIPTSTAYPPPPPMPVPPVVHNMPPPPPPGIPNTSSPQQQPVAYMPPPPPGIPNTSSPQQQPVAYMPPPPPDGKMMPPSSPMQPESVVPPSSVSVPMAQIQEQPSQKEAFSWSIFIGGFIAGFILGILRYLFLLCLELDGKKKRAYVIGCSVGFLLAIIIYVIIAVTVSNKSHTIIYY